MRIISNLFNTSYAVGTTSTVNKIKNTTVQALLFTLETLANLTSARITISLFRNGQVTYLVANKLVSYFQSLTELAEGSAQDAKVFYIEVGNLNLQGDDELTVTLEAVVATAAFKISMSNIIHEYRAHEYILKLTDYSETDKQLDGVVRIDLNTSLDTNKNSETAVIITDGIYTAQSLLKDHVALASVESSLEDGDFAGCAITPLFQSIVPQRVRVQGSSALDCVWTQQVLV